MHEFGVKISSSGFQEICCMIYIDNNVVDMMFTFHKTIAEIHFEVQTVIVGFQLCVSYVVDIVFSLQKCYSGFKLFYKIHAEDIINLRI